MCLPRVLFDFQHFTFAFSFYNHILISEACLKFVKAKGNEKDYIKLKSLCEERSKPGIHQYTSKENVIQEQTTEQVFIHFVTSLCYLTSFFHA